MINIQLFFLYTYTIVVQVKNSKSADRVRGRVKWEKLLLLKKQSFLILKINQQFFLIIDVNIQLNSLNYI